MIKGGDLMYGYIHKGNTQVNFYLRVDGFPEVGFFDYSLRDAVKKYRRDYGLIGKHITFIDCR